MNSLEWLDWPAPASVKACYTTRTGGFSHAPFDSFNLARHVGDSEAAVTANRQRLLELTGVPVCWLNQVHGTGVVPASPENIGADADAAYVCMPEMAAGVMTADCLPVFLCHRNGNQAAVVHAGWRGLLAGVIESTVNKCGGAGSDWIAYLGPAIGPAAFEVGAEVRQAYISANTVHEKAFQPLPTPGKYLADIYQLARQNLQQLGIGLIYGGQSCTVTESERFFSYRRDHTTGRMASLIWIE
ncbi:peptidoglycan editing factor PgeF [Gynuella sp.]|uniref:peptidoglycan editing factor PgeF n=1 Tax=Gynuella sp. TaxID=2969146 RepID=UPI003D0F175B